MVALFADSSAVVKAYVAETGSAWLRAQIDPTAGNLCLVSRITAVEVAAALARRARDGSLTAAEAQQSLLALRSDLRTVFQVAEVHAALVDRAMDLAFAHGLRGYDAVQLAALLHVVQEFAATGAGPPIFLCSDADLIAAAASEGVPTDDPNLHP